MPGPGDPPPVPAALPADPVESLDDVTEDHARAHVSVAEIVAEDLDSPHTPSFRSRIHPEGMTGFAVDREPLNLDDLDQDQG